MRTEKRNRQGNLAREKLVFEYTTALENGDPTTLARILAFAERDPILNRMIAEVNEVYSAEDTVLNPLLSPSVPRPNRQLPTNAQERVLRALPRTRQETNMRMEIASPARQKALARPLIQVPLTLIAAGFGIVLMGFMLILMIQPNRNPTPGGLSALQGAETATFTPTFTATPIPFGVPTLSPFDTGSGNVISIELPPSMAADAMRATILGLVDQALKDGLILPMQIVINRPGGIPYVINITASDRGVANDMPGATAIPGIWSTPTPMPITSTPLPVGATQPPTIIAPPSAIPATSTPIP